MRETYIAVQHNRAAFAEKHCRSTLNTTYFSRSAAVAALSVRREAHSFHRCMQGRQSQHLPTFSSLQLPAIVLTLLYFVQERVGGKIMWISRNTARFENCVCTRSQSYGCTDSVDACTALFPTSHHIECHDVGPPSCTCSCTSSCHACRSTLHLYTTHPHHTGMCTGP